MRKSNIYLFIFITILFFDLPYAFCQIDDDLVLQNISNKMQLYSKGKKSSIIFSHFDKNVYNTAEKVWFTTYVLKPISELNNYHTFSVALIKNDNKKIINTQEFALNNGIGSGCFTLPDSIMPGAYSIVTFTNMLLNNEVDDIFVQPITIKSSSSPDLVINISIIDSAYVSDSLRVLVKVSNSAYTGINNQMVNYSLGIGQYMTSGVVKTNQNGEAFICLSKKVLSPDKSLLKVFVKHNFDYKETFLQVPNLDEKVSVSFYPEGGVMVDNLTSIVGFETKDALGTPIQVKGSIYENNDKLFNVSSNQRGYGKFILKRLPGKIYSFKIEDDEIKSSHFFPLPKSLPNGVTLQIPKAIVNDTLDVLVQGTEINKKFTILLHNFEQVFNKFDFVLTKSSKKIKFLLNDIPKGLFEITIIDSNSLPLAERIAFAHFNKRINVDISTSKETYQVRDSIFLKVKVTDDLGLPQKSFFSFACVQDARIDPFKYREITSTFYLSNQLLSAPIDNLYTDKTSNKSTELLEDILLIKGWRKFKWQDMINVQEKDTISFISSLNYTASLKVNDDHKSKNGYNLLILKDDGYESIQSGVTTFTIPPTAFRTVGNSVLISVNDNHKEPVAFSIQNPYKISIEKIKQANLFSGSDYSYHNYKKKQPLNISLDESIKQLETVVVTSYIKCNRPSQLNACGDYVCKNGALNCPVHVYCGTPAIDGKQYYISMGGQLKMTTYNCFASSKSPSSSSVLMSGISSPRIFYGVEYQIDGNDEDILLNTLNWQNGVITNERGEAIIKFKASDLTGKFKCILNGITSMDKFSATKDFIIKKNL